MAADIVKYKFEGASFWAKIYVAVRAGSDHLSEGGAPFLTDNILPCVIPRIFCTEFHAVISVSGWYGGIIKDPYMVVLS